MERPLSQAGANREVGRVTGTGETLSGRHASRPIASDPQQSAAAHSGSVADRVAAECLGPGSVLSRSSAGPANGAQLLSPQRLCNAKGYSATRRPQCAASTEKSASQWRMATPASKATAAMRQSISFRTVAPCWRHWRYRIAACS